MGVAIGGLAAGALSGAAGAAATAGEKAHAQKALVTRSDLPRGWTSSPVLSTSASGGGLTGSTQLARCIGVSTTLVATNPPKVTSPLFQRPGGSELVEDTVSIYPSASYARAVYNVVSNPKAAGCIGSLLNSASQGAGATDQVTVKRVASPSGTVAFTLAQRITAGTTSTPTSTEVVYFFKGRYGNGLDIETSGTRPPTALTNRLLAVARGRL